MQIDQTYELLDINKVSLHPQNPRRGDLDAIGSSIDANGWYGAITVQKSTGFILAGNHRYRAAVERGATEIPAVVLDVDDERATRILLADNRTADLGTYDEDVLTAVLESLEDLTGTGFDTVLEAALVSPAPVAPDPDDPILESDLRPDEYTPQYAVVVTVADEDEQRRVFELLQDTLGDSDGSIEIRLVAV
jgi:hypothetical protein